MSSTRASKAAKSTINCHQLPLATSSGLISQNCSSTPKPIYEDLNAVKKTTERTGKFGTSETSEGSLSTENYAASNKMAIRNDNYASRPRSMPAEICTNSSNEGSYTAHDCESSLYDTKSNLEIFPEDTELSVHSVQQMEIVKETSIVPGNQISSKACTEVQLKLTCTPPSLVDNDVVDSTNTDQYAYRDVMYKQHSVGKCSRELEATVQHRCDGALTVNRHAVAGALAGSVVSASLHPVDTVKTLIQANSSGQSSFYHTLRHILVERGILGLYGGLASKLACSAPISAIYTFTYEIVKGNLLPILPKEYHSIAHCTAGGCSSIATSFVFTPSECIKQQLQVGSQYQNCWNALVGCLRRGGVASLYAGWGAVLCRNIPHSIIKFYAYESLKQFLLESAPANAKLNSGQTLLCGGLAGSTAALFTTPFDVVKTRLQLQALSPSSKYEGVLHALREIFLQEGFRGLYRGLTPRLAIYISQGGIFFTSYEFLKTVMFPEQELPATTTRF
ncbi:hypothetical protein QOZ80_2BG0195770 [Eleusine coracana subsp. coracana]|nr:hypothetical protein QOZ80_2BG0195770 [Eleusine coracana subsp. coracana]